MSERWVQHKSGQGEKYKIKEEHQHFWRVDDHCQQEWFLRIPKPDYIECDPPEVWEECTREVVGISDQVLVINKHPVCGVLDSDQRYAWRDDALVIERKK